MVATVVHIDDYRRSLRPQRPATVETVPLAAMFVVWVPVMVLVPLWRVA